MLFAIVFYLSLAATLLIANMAQAVNFLSADVYESSLCNDTANIQPQPYYPTGVCLQISATTSQIATCSDSSTNFSYSAWLSSPNCGVQPDSVTSGTKACTPGQQSTISASAFNCVDYNASSIVHLQQCNSAFAGSYYVMNFCYHSTPSSPSTYGFKFTSDGGKITANNYKTVDCSDTPTTLSASPNQCVNVSLIGSNPSPLMMSTLSGGTQINSSVFVAFALSCITYVVLCE